METETDKQPDTKRRKSDSATDTDDLHTTEVEVGVLASINKKLDMLVTIYKELNDMRKSLEFAHNQIETLQQSNQDLKTSVATLTQQMQNEFQKRHPTIQNYIFKTSCKLPADIARNITFHRIHRLSKVQEDKIRPIIVKFEHYQHKELLKSKGKLLKDTNFGMNEQYPREINERRKALYPILKETCSMMFMSGDWAGQSWSTLIFFAFVEMEDWPAQSPDMNIIEHVCGRMKEGAWKTKPKKNLDELWEACKTAFFAIPDDFINKLYESLSNRMESNCMEMQSFKLMECRDTPVVAELGHLLTSQTEEPEPPGALQVLLRSEVKLLLKLLQTKVLWGGHFPTARHLGRRQPGGGGVDHTIGIMPMLAPC
ncbi:hypothetical protein N1851_030161 [Merluccius polli]|uniref:Uncharacterized protein n=1 Tax=Merluccius polli TaxID=89951 RepID=A0AA47NQ85_MERPO|nr:hypothetical protein N1851_030161 [Merluccius polli]